jgi:glycosyltransferase involved in cell wall biosynthesis
VSNQPLVSLVTPSFNQGSFIAQTINSVLTQDYPALEYLVMDGASQDETVEVLRSYGERLRWISEPDNGQSAAINKGWQQASGEIVAWLNSDDLLLPGAITAVAAEFRQYPDAMLVYGDGNYIDEEGKLIGRYATRPYDYATLLKSATNFIPQPAMFIRRTALEQIGWLDEKLHYAMDYDLCLKIGARWPVRYLPRRLAALRLHTAAKSLRAIADFGPEVVSVIEEIFASGTVPGHLQNDRAEACRNARLYAAYCCFWSGEPTLARSWLGKVWRETPLRHLPRRFFQMVLLTSLGKPGYKTAAQLYGNPFNLRATTN